MALEKQPIQISFGQGLQTNIDPLQLPAGKMLELENAVFTKQGLLKKRNGFAPLVSLPDNSSQVLTTYFDNLIAVGNSLNLYSEGTGQWINKGNFDPISLSVIPLVRSSLGQNVLDVATSKNNLACSVFKDSANVWSYQISDSVTGQIILSQTSLPSTATLARVFVLGDYFIITFLITAGTTHLKYIAVPIDTPNFPGSVTDISSQVKSLTASYDGVVNNNNLYLAFNGSDVGGAIRVTSLDSSLLQHSTTIIATFSGDIISLLFDPKEGAGNLFLIFIDSAKGNVYTSVLSHSIVSILAPQIMRASTNIVIMAGTVDQGVLNLFYQSSSTYSFSSTRSDYLDSDNCLYQYSSNTLTIVSSQTIRRGLGLASKAFYHAGTNLSYMLSVYPGSLQPTYFLLDQYGNIISKLAYSNAGGYAQTQILPQVNLSGDQVQIGYLYKDVIVPVNESQGVASANGIYTQTGINLVTFKFKTTTIITSEIAGSLHLTGGQYYQYDGTKVVEHGFHLFPEDIVATSATTGGSVSKQKYFYYFCYEWTDSQGLIHRSAPSVPLPVDLSGSATNTNTVTINIPTLRVTSKTGYSSVRIVGYRWSQAQQVIYQFTSISAPTLNNLSTDSVTITDTLADSSILGNLVLYTTGHVLENIAAPASICSTLYQKRVVLIDAENPNNLWISKPVDEATPVEFSDLLKVYLPPTFGTQGTLGGNKVVAAMDDKLIISKPNSFYYISGQGPDNTGNNNDFTNPVFITNSLGSDNPESFVLIPQGLMFQSDKGIWLLGRDLSIKYIGDAVSDYNDSRVLSSCLIPGTTHVRFLLDSGVTLIYDYFFDQWGVFKGVKGGSSTIYKGLHTYLNSRGQVFRESPGVFLDGSSPVLLKFKTSWLKLTGLQGFQRAYFFFLLGKYLSPHKLVLKISYDGDDATTQQSIISPDNYSPAWGMDTLFGDSTPWGGPSNLEAWRVSLDRQKCESISILVQEIFDASFGVPPGEGFELSGINLIVGAKSGYPRRPASRSAG